MRIESTGLASVGFTSNRSRLDQKDKILLSTPALAALSTAYKKRRGMPSKMILEGARSGLKWGAFLLSLCTMLGANKFLTKNSKKVRDYENNHALISMACVGAASTGGYYLLNEFGNNLANNHPKISNGVVNTIKEIDENGLVMGIKETMRDARLSYRRMILNQPDYIKKSARFMSRMTRTTMASLPYVGAGVACAIAIIKPKMLSRD